MPEMRLPFRPVPTAKERAQLALDDAKEAFGSGGEALEAVAAFIKRMKEGRRAMAYDSRWRGARDQEPEVGREEELAALLSELIGEDRAAPVLKYIRDCRAASAQDQPPDFQGKPLTGGGMVPTTGSLTYEPAGSKSANAASAQDRAWDRALYPDKLRHLQHEAAVKQFNEALRSNPGAMALDAANGRRAKSYAERFPDAMRLVNN
jgi:hypothetical protein